MAGRRSEPNLDDECFDCYTADLNLEIDWPAAPPRPPELHRHVEDGFIHLSTEKAEADPAILEGITGKYLFFSASPLARWMVATNELLNHGFHVAKMSLPPNFRGRGGTGVLCIYHSDDSRRYELRDRHHAEYHHSLPVQVEYRDWKSDADSRAGVYSEKYLSTLTKAEEVLQAAGRLAMLGLDPEEVVEKGGEQWVWRERDGRTRAVGGSGASRAGPGG